MVDLTPMHVEEAVAPKKDGPDRKSTKVLGWDLDNYRPITLLKTEFKIMTKILLECLQSVAKILLRAKQTCSVKSQTIQRNLHLICMILEGAKDDKQATLINLDQSKALNRVDHHYLAAVLQAARFKLDFCQRISLLHHSSSTMVQVNGKRFRTFVFAYLAIGSELTIS